jgi:hypothetical protein
MADFRYSATAEPLKPRKLGLTQASRSQAEREGVARGSWARVFPTFFEPSLDL